MKKLKIMALIIGSALIGGVLAEWGRHQISTNSMYQGPVAENFAALDQEGHYFELYRNHYEENLKAIVLITDGLGCPIVQKNIPIVQELARTYSQRGVKFLLINSNPQDSRQKIIDYVKNFQIQTPILLDPGQMIARGLNMGRTSEAVLIETKSWKILYQGAIHDRLNYEVEKFQASQNYLKDAIEEYLQGKPISVNHTQSVGCSISDGHWDPITFYEHVQPILKAKCLNCHRASGAPPQNLESYEDAKAWGSMIREVVRTRRMPPWEPDNFFGSFANDYSLTDEETRILTKWVETGAQKGDPSKEKKFQPRRPKTSQQYHADLVYGPFEDEVPAQTETPWKYRLLGRADRDLWIRAKKTEINKRGLMNHLSLIVMKNPMDLSSNIFEPHYMTARDDLVSILRFPAYDPNAQFFPQGTIFKIPKGSYLYLEEHFYLSGKTEKVSAQVSLQLEKPNPKLKTIFYQPYGKRDFVIPPGADNYVLRREAVIDRPLALMTIMVHMHMRGLSAKVSVTHADGRKEVLLSIPKFLFKNKTAYVFREPHHLVPGDKLELEGVYSNSKNNPYGLDFTKPIVHGADSANNEMFLVHLSGYEE